MVGRTPEYLGKKIEAREVKFVMLSALIMTFSMLGFAAVAAVLPIALKGLQESGTHGLSDAEAPAVAAFLADRLADAEFQS